MSGPPVPTPKTAWCAKANFGGLRGGVSHWAWGTISAERSRRSAGRWLHSRWRTRLSSGPRAHLVIVKSRTGDLQTLGRWIEEGRLAPVVDRVYPLEDAREAHAYTETKRARGKVVLPIA